MAVSWSRLDRLTPQTGPQPQLIAAATLWLAAAAMLLVRGVLFVEAPAQQFHPNFWLIPIAVVAGTIGIVKARLILVDYAHANVARIHGRGHSWFFGFLSAKSWLFITVMMGGGLLLRHSFLADTGWGRALLAVLYLAVATALLVADRILWVAVFEPAGSTARI